MPTTEERLTSEFFEWEALGRGWQVWDYPVLPEPPFRVFPGYGTVPYASVPDDGKRPTILSALVRGISSRLVGRGLSRETQKEPTKTEPEYFSREELAVLQAFVPAKLHFGKEEYANFLSSLSSCREPIAFEILGEATQICVQFAASPSDMPILRRQLESYFPNAAFIPGHDVLKAAWSNIDPTHVAIVEFGLAREFMCTLSGATFDPFVALAGALSDLKKDEFGLFQVLFSPVRHPWASSILRAVTDEEGKAFFINAPELFKGAKEKVSRSLYAAVIRLAIGSDDFDSAWGVARDVAAALGVVGSIDGNELIPLSNEGYPLNDHIEDILCRQSHRSGMIINADELTNFAHLPSSDVRSPKLLRQTRTTKAAPALVRGDEGLLLGNNLHHGVRTPVRISREAQKRHTHIIGASGTGKSTLLFNLITQDIERGEGVAVMDPHGDLIDRILGAIPETRIRDVVLVDPSDTEFSIGFNILFAHSELEKTLLASDLVAIFQRNSSAWGDQLESVLRNAINAFLESDEGGSLADLRRFLLEATYREDFLRTVRDPEIVYYWRTGFKQLSGNKSVGSVLTRLETFLSHKAIRRMVSQKTNRLDFARILDTRKIFLAKLSQGLIGRENSYLLGSLLVAKFQQLAMARAELGERSRSDFHFYIDEFFNFLCPSMAEILSGARKYGLSLTLAHQELRQLERDKNVSSAVLSNCYTRVCFRVGEQDARSLSSGFSSFEDKDLQNLATGEAIARVERSDFDFNLAVENPPRPDDKDEVDRRRRVIDASRAKYGTANREIEAALFREREMTPAKIEEPSPVEAIPVASLVIPKPLVAESDLGRGGVQHQAVQKRLKEGAEALGYRAIIEKQILDGTGSVDVVFERDGVSIACEISVTTTIDHEVGNVSKCIKAGFPKVAVVALSEEKLSKLKAGISNSLGPDVAGRVSYFLPDAFLVELREALAVFSTEPSETKSHGYKVKRTYATLSTDEVRVREEAALKLIAEAMRRSKKQ